MTSKNEQYYFWNEKKIATRYWHRMSFFWHRKMNNIIIILILFKKKQILTQDSSSRLLADVIFRLGICWQTERGKRWAFPKVFDKDISYPNHNPRYQACIYIKSDCIYHFPIDLEPNGRPFGSKSIGKL